MRCRHRTLADRQVNSATEHPLVSAGETADDIDEARRRVRLVLGIALVYTSVNIHHRDKIFVPYNVQK